MLGPKTLANGLNAISGFQQARSIAFLHDRHGDPFLLNRNVNKLSSPRLYWPKNEAGGMRKMKKVLRNLEATIDHSLWSLEEEAENPHYQLLIFELGRLRMLVREINKITSYEW